MPHFHLSGFHFWTNALCAMVAIGAFHLLAISYPENRVAKAYLGLGL